MSQADVRGSWNAKAERGFSRVDSTCETFFTVRVDVPANVDIYSLSVRVTPPGAYYPETKTRIPLGALPLRFNYPADLIVIDRPIAGTYVVEVMVDYVTRIAAGTVTVH